jgi:hypothetical protein
MCRCLEEMDGTFKNLQLRTEYVIANRGYPSPSKRRTLKYPYIISLKRCLLPILV